jgi:ADP-ribosyltransferase exoenzyme
VPTVAPRLPNPDAMNDPTWTLFATYLIQNGIVEARGASLEAYQMASSGPYLSAGEVNHCLALRHFGAGSDYAALARDRYGSSEDDWKPTRSIGELDALFAAQSCRFSADSVVFKGIGMEPYYEVLKLATASVGEVVTFPGFLSTSVCREKARSFSRGSPSLLLQIQGLDRINAIVPPNRCVPYSPTPSIPEQEVLLDRGLSFKVIDRLEQTNEMLVSLEAQCGLVSSKRPALREVL